MLKFGNVQKLYTESAQVMDHYGIASFTSESQCRQTRSSRRIVEVNAFLLQRRTGVAVLLQHTRA